MASGKDVRMAKLQRISVILLVVLLGATIFGLVRTNRAANAPLSQDKKNHTAPSQAPLVDLSPLKTAQELARLVNASEELPLAQEALRLADYEVDLAYSAALREAREHPPVLNAEQKEIQARLQSAQKQLQADQAQVDQLTAALAKTTGDRKEALADELAQAKADLELDQDEVDDAREDLIRAGGDPEDRVQEMKREHEATHGNPAIPGGSAPAEERGLIHRFEQWSALHEKQLRLWKAKAEAEAAAATLSAEHNALDVRIDAEKTSTPELARHAKHAVAAGHSTSSAAPSRTNRSREEAAALLARTKRIASDQKGLANFDKRIDAEKELANIYGQWIEVVAARQSAVVHRMLLGVLIVLAIALVGFFFNSWLEKLLQKMSLDRRQVQTLRTITRVSLQVVALLFILLVIFGPPGQLGTVLGLAGAGLTVALKDFIVGFFGWFVLMGKNGIRLGDWVEINGVTGEVVEIGLFHTVLLETGNWTDAGHPTGRRVTFTNNFAIEGHYFNFSTSGQWLWDELSLVLPVDRDPFPIIDAIRKKVLEATQESARQAEQEWQRAAHSREMSSFSAAPAITLKPVIGGVEVTVRYVTRANERYRLRANLYQAAVELLGGKSFQPSASASPA